MKEKNIRKLTKIFINVTTVLKKDQYNFEINNTNNDNDNK